MSEHRPGSILNIIVLGIIFPAAIGLGLCVLMVRVANDYGWTLFLGVPLLVSFLSAFFSRRFRTLRFAAGYGLAVSSIFLLGALIVLIAMDGLGCLIMALPLALLLALVGTALGLAAGVSKRGKGGSAMSLVLIVALPGLNVLERKVRPPPELREVKTRVKIAAPAARVWPIVVEFPAIDEPPRGIFLCGIAYPTEARIEGRGVGAMRHCVFSTGNFVEPITVWDEPVRLAFDVVSSPPPMKELSIYAHVDAPHLHGFMVSERGEFLLRQEGSDTILEGTTWYRHDLAPGWYWGPISDYIIHRIHERVLEHIRRTVEKR